MPLTFPFNPFTTKGVIVETCFWDEMKVYKVYVDEGVGLVVCADAAYETKEMVLKTFFKYSKRLSFKYNLKNKHDRKNSFWRGRKTSNSNRGK